MCLFTVSCKTAQKPVLEANLEQPPMEKKDVIPHYVPDPAPYQPANDKVNDLIHTRLDVSFDWEKQYLIGKANLTFKPYFYPQETLELDAKGFDIDYVRLIQGDVVRELRYKYVDSLKLIIGLDREYTRDEQFEVQIKYIAKPNELPDAGGSSAITKDLGLYFINPLGDEEGKPKQIWTQGETEASSCWFPTIDSPNEKTTQEMYITVDTSYVTLSNGTLIYSKDNGDGTKTEYWKQDKPHAPYLFMMAVGEFSVVEDEWDGLDVDYYVEPAYESHAKSVFGNTPEMLQFFSDRLGYKYPWDKYSQVVVRDFVSGAMENTSASVFMEQVQITSRETLDKNWDYIIAHELFHHWFGDLVTAESWSNLALNESFANYSEYLWSEYKYGREAADEHRQEELAGYLGQAASKQYPIIRYNYVHRMEMFDGHSYNKGGLVLHMLRKYLGDDAFFKSLEHYLNKNQFTDAEIHELRLSFEDVTGLDLKWYFDQWFLSPGHADLKVTHLFDGDTLILKVNQLQDSLYTPVFELPVDIELGKKDSKSIHEITISSANETFRIPLTEKPDYVLFDAEQQVLGTVNHQKSMGEWIAQYKLSDKYQARYDALDTISKYLSTVRALEKYAPSGSLNYGVISWGLDSSVHQEMLTTAPELEALLMEAMNDDYNGLRKEAVDIVGVLGLSGRGKKQLIRLAISDSAARVRASAFDALASIDSVQSTLQDVYRQGIKDSSYAVIASALQGYIKSDAEDAGDLIEQFRDSDKTEIINGVASYYIFAKDSSQFNWMSEKFESAKPIGKIKFSPLFADYLKVVDSVRFEQGVQILEKNAKHESDIYIRFSGYKGLLLLDEIAGIRERRREIVKNEDNPRLIQVYERKEAELDRAASEK